MECEVSKVHSNQVLEWLMEGEVRTNVSPQLELKSILEVANS